MKVTTLGEPRKVVSADLASDPARMSGGDAVVHGLKRWSVDTLFGVPGVQLDDFFDALVRLGSGIRLVHTRHEQGAAYMALGYAMATGKPGVCAVVPGPGVLNAGAALATAYACNARVLFLTSTVSTALIDGRHGALHEIADQTGLLRNLSKWNARAQHVSQIPQLMDEAFRQLLTGRPQPVALEIPPDVLAQKGMVAYAAQRPALTNPSPDPEAIAKAAALCADARNPMIVVGSGALHAGAEIRQLAEILQAPVVSRNLGRGTLRDDDDYAMPAAAALPSWRDVDVVIGIGTRLQQLREWGMDDALKVVRIDLDYAEMVRVTPPAVALYADAAEATANLVKALAQTPSRPSKVKEFRAVKAAFREEVARDMHPQVALLDVIRASMAEDDIFVDEMTQIGYAARYALPVYAPRTFINSGYQGTLGYGFATALGAQVGAGQRRVYSVNGDGGFMYTLPELATAVLHKIPLIAIVFSDGYFGNVRRMQINRYDGRVIGSQLHNPDFAVLAQTFGATGIRAEGPAALEEALAKARGCNGPVVIEVPMNLADIPSPWKHIHGRKVR